jgi:hypothetical protein
MSAEEIYDSPPVLCWGVGGAGGWGGWDNGGMFLTAFSLSFFCFRFFIPLESLTCSYYFLFEIPYTVDMFCFVLIT